MDILIPRGTATPLVFWMVLATDHRTAAPGLSPTVQISKVGSAFATPAGAVSEIGSGAYQVAANAADVNTSGPLMLRATAAGADTLDTYYLIIPQLGAPYLVAGTVGFPLPFLVISSVDHESG